MPCAMPCSGRGRARGELRRVRRFTVGGMGTFRPGPGTTPYSGEQGLRSSEVEFRLSSSSSTMRPSSRPSSAMLAAHPFEEVAYDRYPIANHHQGIGSGLVGEYDRQNP